MENLSCPAAYSRSYSSASSSLSVAPVQPLTCTIMCLERLPCCLGVAQWLRHLHRKLFEWQLPRATGSLVFLTVTAGATEPTSTLRTTAPARLRMCCVQPGSWSIRCPRPLFGGTGKLGRGKKSPFMPARGTFSSSSPGCASIRAGAAVTLGGRNGRHIAGPPQIAFSGIRRACEASFPSSVGSEYERRDADESTKFVGQNPEGRECFSSSDLVHGDTAKAWLRNLSTFWPVQDIHLPRRLRLCLPREAARLAIELALDDPGGGGRRREGAH
jgi:hypothetical protein